jgi:hypothetical protein
MNPSADGIKYSPVIALNLPNFKKIVTAFCKNLFALSRQILTKIERAVANDKTIIIVAVRLNPTARVDRMFCKYIQKLIVVASVSYQTYPNPTNGLATDFCFIDRCCKFCSATPNIDSLLASERNWNIPVCPGYQMLRKYEI